MSRIDRVRPRRRSAWQIFAGPLAVALLSVIGLAVALTGDGPRDALSWAALAVPVLVTARAWRRRS